MDTEKKENNAILGVVVVVLVVLLLGLLSYLIFFLPKKGVDVLEDTKDTTVQEEEDGDSQVVDDTEVVVDEEDTDENTVTDEDQEASDLEETEVQVTYMGSSSDVSGYVYFEDATGDKYFMNGLSLASVDVDREFVIKVESEEEIAEGKKVTGEVYYFKVLTYKGAGEDVHEDYTDYIYFEIEGEEGIEVYFLKDYGISISLDNDYDFLFGSLEELDSAAGTSYWKMGGRFEYSSH